MHFEEASLTVNPAQPCAGALCVGVDYVITFRLDHEGGRPDDDRVALEKLGIELDRKLDDGSYTPFASFSDDSLQCEGRWQVLPYAISAPITLRIRWREVKGDEGWSSRPVLRYQCDADEPESRLREEGKHPLTTTIDGQDVRGPALIRNGRFEIDLSGMSAQQGWLGGAPDSWAASGAIDF
jgi:hypothetical protein